MAYITLADLRGYRGIDATADDALLQAAIASATRYVEFKTGRYFEAQTATRYYLEDARDREDTTKLHLDEDLLTITTLSNGDSSATAITSANYWLLDRNLGPPYHWIKLYSNTGVYWQWDIDCWVSVAGTWGYRATCPADLKQAVRVLASYYYHQKDTSTYDVTAVPEAGVMVIPQGVPKTTMDVITSYMKRV
jgi:uncharacterized phiE125 gp8 family phage protein